MDTRKNKMISSKAPRTRGGKKLQAYGLRDVAEMSGLGLNTIYIHSREGKFPNEFKVGNRKLVPKRDFIAAYGFDPDPDEEENDNKEG